MIHGDIRPEYISFSESEKRYKLADRLADMSPPFECQRNNMIRQRSLFMAPVIFGAQVKQQEKAR